MNRSLRAQVAFSFALIFSTVVPASNGTITETEALGLFFDQSPQARRVPLVAQSAAADARVGTRVANPEVAYLIENAAGVREQFLVFEQELPLTGRRGVLGKRAHAASTTAALRARAELQNDAYALKRSFYELLYRERLLERLRGGERLLERTVEVLHRRETEGEGSGYDALRAEQALADLWIRGAEAQAGLAAARADFGSFFAPELKMHTARPEGALAPPGEAPETGPAIAEALEQRIDLQAISADQLRLDLEYKAARRRRFPEPTLMAGWKRTEALNLSDTGFTASLAVPLPIFDRGKFESARARTDAERVDIEKEILKRRIRAEVQAALAREQAARRSARRYGREFETRASELRNMAQLRYDEGESGILELLDAYQASLTAELQALAARYAARSAEIERNRAIGTEVTP